MMRQTTKVPGLLLLVFCLAACSSRLHQVRFVLLPDTQTYAEKYPAVLDSQVNWITRNSSNIHMVLQQGDLTQNNNDAEWQRVQQAFTKLNGKVPYILAAGNHDMGSAPGKYADVRNTALFNQYFPVGTMQHLPAFGGVFEAGKMENAWYFLKTGRVHWLLITLEFGPRNSKVQQASELIAKHPDKLVVINTHAYMYSDSTRQNQNDSWRPQAYGVGKDTGDAAVNDGEDLWNKLVRRHSNVRFVFSGHVLKSGVGTLISINDAGNPVYQMLANYQEGVTGSVMGGNGYLRILDMNLKHRTLKVQTWSPFINEQLHTPGHNFTIKNVLYSPY